MSKNEKNQGGKYEIDPNAIEFPPIETSESYDPASDLDEPWHNEPEDSTLSLIIDAAVKGTEIKIAKKERIIIAETLFKGIFSDMLEAVDPDGNIGLALIDAATDGGNMSAGIGLDKILEIAPTGQEMILSGWLPVTMYANDPRWQAALAYPNIHFARLPFDKEQLERIVDEAKTEEKRPFDQLAIDLLTVSQTIDRAKTLNHDLGNALRRMDNEKVNEIITEAKAIFGDKSDQEIMDLIQMTAQTDSTAGELGGKYYPDLFIDIEGTLFDADGNPNEAVLNLIKTCQEFKRRPVTVWTGGDVKTLSKQVRALGLTCKVTSKYNLAGAELETVVDDLPEEEFGRKYQVTVRNYINVNEI